MTLLALVCAVAVVAGEPSVMFDGARGARGWPAFESAAPVAHGPRPAPSRRKPKPRQEEPIPPELLAARQRVGNDAMLAKIAGRGAGEPFTFGVLGDIERGRFWWERIFSPGKTAFHKLWTALSARGVDFTLQLGDFVSEGDVEHYEDYVAMLDALTGPPMPRCPGNHDRSRPNGPADKRLYDAVIGPRDYFFDHAGWRFISVDSSDRKLTDAQLAWFKDAVAAPGPKIVFTHVPPAYIKKLKPLAVVGALGEGELDEEDTDEHKGGYWHDFTTNYFEEGDVEFRRIIETGGVKAVYMGHIHAFWAGDVGGVRYVISGGGGSPLYPLPPGYPKKKFAHGISVEARPDGTFTETVVRLKGASFVLPPVVPAPPASDLAAGVRDTVVQ